MSKAFLVILGVVVFATLTIAHLNQTKEKEGILEEGEKESIITSYNTYDNITPIR